MLKLYSLIIFIFIIFIIKSFLVECNNLMHSNLENNEDNEDKCPENCYNQKCDNETLKCDSCIDGFYSDFCSEKCPTNHCIKCNQNDGICLVCDSHYDLKGENCCIENCNKCENSDDKCLECTSKKYGDSCIDCPYSCKDNGDERKCDQETGKCSLCEKGKRGNFCTENCNIGCNTTENNCNQDDGSCNCKQGFYGNFCDMECDKNCLICQESDGACTQCKSGYYTDLEDNKKCSKCPEKCDGECPDGKCIKCLNGFYGDICDKNCPEKCINKNCDKDSGLCECINHYSKESFCTQCEENYNLTTECNTCINYYDINNNCQSCVNHFDVESECKQCQPYFTIQSLCTACLRNYDINFNCSKCINHFDFNSSCLECESFYDIRTYCKDCIKNYDPLQNCEKCINFFDFDNDCKTCLVGYYGLNCDKKCYEGCNTSISNCIQENGKCDNCIRGYFNDFCNETCYEHCLGEPYSCNPKTGECDECEDLYYGLKCEEKTTVENCIKVNRSGTCIKCEEKFFLKDGLCKKCSSNCTDENCEDETGRCYFCANLNAYGTLCDQLCSEFCQKNNSEYICDRETAACNFGCVNTGNFSDTKCTRCESGFYPRDQGCNLECSDNCEEKTSCDDKDGSCNSCKIGFWGSNCSFDCDNLCKKKECSHENGKCVECIDGYYKDKNSDCKLCPTNCSTCESEEKCLSCNDGYYGNKCNNKCSIHCEGKTCEIKDGKCNCDKNYFGYNCESECNGCSSNGCEDKDGFCKDHYCSDKFYDPRKCDKICSENCLEQKCDIFTGECIICPENKWGKNCENDCNNLCKDDGRLDCCYIKHHEQDKPKGIDIQLTYKIDDNDNLKEEQNEFCFMKINLGGFDLKILVDFETNSPLVIFDYYTSTNPIDTEIYKFYLNKTYKSNGPDSIKGESLDEFYEYDGFFLTKEINAKDTLKIKDISFKNFSFLICQDFKIEKDFETAGYIDGIVGLGLRNIFTENLFYNQEDKFPKNILVKYISGKKAKSVYFGDYPDIIKKSFSKLSTMIIENKQDIVMDKLISFETKFTGIAYSLRKAYHYQYDKRVIINNRIETSIVLNNLYKQFFEKIYFGDLYENGCDFKIVQGGEGEFYCDKGKKAQIQNLPKLGLILGDYIYYLSHEFLYEESENYYTFVIKFHGQGQQKIDLGKSFFNEFSVIYNNGNETLNFFGDIKKLNVPLRDPSNLLNIDSDIFTPGGWVTLIVFITAIIIIFCYLIKYCGEKTDNEDDEEDDIDYEEDSLIDDTLE